jgi:mannose-6-phosphate isomerase
MRLPVHAHPSRAFAREHLGSPFGKAEAWLILGTRHVPREDAPHLRLGFRQAIPRDELLALIERQDTDGLLDAMHVREARAGDVWFIPPGLPHAIGAGVFMVEVQEPSDFSIVVETRGVPIDPADAHLRLGWDVAVDALDLAGTGCRDRRAAPARRARARSGRAAPATADRPRHRLRSSDGADHRPGRAVPTLSLPSRRRRHARQRCCRGWRRDAGDRGRRRVRRTGGARRGRRQAYGLELIACLPPRPWDLETPDATATATA